MSAWTSIYIFLERLTGGAVTEQRKRSESEDGHTRSLSESKANNRIKDTWGRADDNLSLGLDVFNFIMSRCILYYNWCFTGFLTQMKCICVKVHLDQLIVLFIATFLLNLMLYSYFLSRRNFFHTSFLTAVCWVVSGKCGLWSTLSALILAVSPNSGKLCSPRMQEIIFFSGIQTHQKATLLKKD